MISMLFAVAVGDVPRVQAQVDQLGVGVGEEPLHPLLGVDVGVGVRVEHQLDAVLLQQVAGQLVRPRDQVLPLLGVDLRRLGQRAAVHVGVLVGQVHEVLGADLAQQLRLAAEVLLGLVERLLALVQPGEDGAAGDGEVALGQLVAQLPRVLRQEALRAELGVEVAGQRDLVEVLLPADLVVVAREPHAPRVGSGAQAQLGQARRGGGVVRQTVIGQFPPRGSGPRGSDRDAGGPCGPRRSCRRPACCRGRTPGRRGRPTSSRSTAPAPAGRSRCGSRPCAGWS